MLKKWLSAYKSSNISETRQDRTKVAIKVEYEVIYALSIGAKINDLGHVTLTIFGSTVGYPSDSLASCLDSYGRVYATVLRPSVIVCTECIVAKRCVLEQKLLLTAYRKLYVRIHWY